MSINKTQNITGLNNQWHTYQHPLCFILAVWLSSMHSANRCVRYPTASFESAEVGVCSVLEALLQ